MTEELLTKQQIADRAGITVFAVEWRLKSAGIKRSDKGQRHMPGQYRVTPSILQPAHQGRRGPALVKRPPTFEPGECHTCRSNGAYVRLVSPCGCSEYRCARCAERPTTLTIRQVANGWQHGCGVVLPLTSWRITREGANP